MFRALLCEAALNNWSVKHADVKNAFCNAYMDVEDLFITMPNGITVHDPNPDPTRRRGIVLEKALYGLKQSPRLWYKDIRTHLVSNGLSCLPRDSTVFTHKDKTTNIVTFVLVYVDDIIITGPDPSLCDKVRDILEKKYTLGSYEDIQCSYLGINIERIPNGFKLDMSHRIGEILDEFPVSISPAPPTRMVPRIVHWEQWSNLSIDSLSRYQRASLPS